MTEQPSTDQSEGPLKRSVTIAGHRTSITLEPVFWTLLNRAAGEDDKSLNALVTEIDAARTTNLSSAIRTYLVGRFIDQGEP